MAAIMIVGHGTGARSCDAICHRAKPGSCGCVCGGRYHAIGSSELARSAFAADAAAGTFGSYVALQLQATRRSRPIRLSAPLPAS